MRVDFGTHDQLLHVPALRCETAFKPIAQLVLLTNLVCPVLLSGDLKQPQRQLLTGWSAHARSWIEESSTLSKSNDRDGSVPPLHRNEVIPAVHTEKVSAVGHVN